MHKALRPPRLDSPVSKPGLEARPVGVTTYDTSGAPAPAAPHAVLAGRAGELPTPVTNDQTTNDDGGGGAAAGPPVNSSDLPSPDERVDPPFCPDMWERLYRKKAVRRHSRGPPGF